MHRSPRSGSGFEHLEPTRPGSLTRYNNHAKVAGRSRLRPAPEPPGDSPTVCGPNSSPRERAGRQSQVVLCSTYTAARAQDPESARVSFNSSSPGDRSGPSFAAELSPVTSRRRSRLRMSCAARDIREEPFQAGVEDGSSIFRRACAAPIRYGAKKRLTAD